MNYTFKTEYGSAWSVEDDRIVSNGVIYHFSDIRSVNLIHAEEYARPGVSIPKPGEIQIRYSGGSQFFQFPYSQRLDAEKAYLHVKTNCGRVQAGESQQNGVHKIFLAVLIIAPILLVLSLVSSSGWMMVAGIIAGIVGLFGFFSTSPKESVSHSEKEAREDAYTAKMLADMEREKQKQNKEASVIGRAVVGGVIAGPTGAVVGAISAVDKNMQNGTQSKEKASVVGRAVAGGVIAGPTGAVVGAISAVDKNARNNEEN